MWFISYLFKVHCKLGLSLGYAVTWRHRLLQYCSNNFLMYGFMVIYWSNSGKEKRRLTSLSLEGNDAVSVQISLTKWVTWSFKVNWGILTRVIPWIRQRKAPSLSFFSCEGIKKKDEKLVYWLLKLSRESNTLFPLAFC